eukprot:g1933.t1
MIIYLNLAFRGAVDDGLSAEEVRELISSVVLAGGGSHIQATGAGEAAAGAVNRAIAQQSESAAVTPDWNAVAAEIAAGNLGNSDTADKDGDGDVDSADEKIKQEQMGIEQSLLDKDSGSAVMDTEMKVLLGLSVALAFLPILCGACCSCASRNCSKFKYECLIGEGCGCQCCRCCCSEKTRKQAEDRYDRDPVEFLTSLNTVNFGKGGVAPAARTTMLVELTTKEERRAAKEFESKNDIRSLEAGSSAALRFGVRKSSSSASSGRRAGRITGAKQAQSLDVYASPVAESRLIRKKPAIHGASDGQSVMSKIANRRSQKI